MSTPSPEPPYLKPEAAYPCLVPLGHAAATGDWPTISAFFTNPANLQLHDTAVWVVGKVDGAERLLHAVLAAEPAAGPAAGLARVLLACRLINIGWGIRGAARARHVSAEQFTAFHDHLRRAERLLMEGTARDPDNVAAWVLRLTTARGLQLGQSEARRRYDQVARRDPVRMSAQFQLLQQLCPKWGGSWEKTNAFARECVAAAPPGAPNAVMVAEAHIERWLDIDDEAQAVGYLRQPAVHAELVDAARRSVLHPSSRPEQYGWVTAHSTFAMVFSLIGDLAAAAVHFRALGTLGTEQPWAYLGDAATEFRRHRAAALAGRS